MSKNIGLPDNVVIIVPHQQNWRAIFAGTSERLSKALEAYHPIIEHIGSTSVPGLAAKPIIDIALAIGAMPPDSQLLRLLSEAGFPRQREVMAGWWSFNEGDPATHHIHLVAKGSVRLRDFLTFRDALREDAEMAGQYAVLKNELSRRFPNNTQDYREGKDDFIKAIIGRKCSH